MNRCQNCDIKISGGISVCPLCHNELPYDTEPTPAIFHRVKSDRAGRLSFNKIYGFCALNILALCVFVNLYYFKSMYWSLVVAAGLLYVYALVKNTILAKGEIHKKLFIQIILIALSLIAVSIVFKKYNLQWIYSYALPILFAASALAFGILIFIRVKNFHNYIIYELLILAMGIAPGIIAFAGIGDQKLPSIVCFFVCCFVFLSNIVFSWGFLKNELKKRFHA